MPFFIPALIAGVSALAGGLGNKNKKIDNSVNQTTEQNINQTTNPIYDMDLKNELQNQYMADLQGGNDEADNITRGSIYNINKQYGLAAQTAENFARARGLGRTTIGSVPAASVFAGRAGATADAENQNPLLRRQFRQQNLGNLASFFSRLPVGQTTTGSQTTHTTGTGQTVQQGSPWGGAIGNLGATMAGLYGVGAFDPKQKPSNPSGNAGWPGSPGYFSAGNNPDPSGRE